MKDVRLPCNSVGDPAPAVKWTKDRYVADPGGVVWPLRYRKLFGHYSVLWWSYRTYGTAHSSLHTTIPLHPQAISFFLGGLRDRDTLEIPRKY